jgi:hypothetical protein
MPKESYKINQQSSFLVSKCACGRRRNFSVGQLSHLEISTLQEKQKHQLNLDLPTYGECCGDATTPGIMPNA